MGSWWASRACDRSNKVEEDMLNEIEILDDYKPRWYQIEFEKACFLDIGEHSFFTIVEQGKTIAVGC